MERTILETGMSDHNETQGKPLPPLRAIRRHCLQCSNTPKQVRECTSTSCWLYRFRLGHNPARTGIGPGCVLKSLSKGLERDSTPVSSGIDAETGSRVGDARSLDNGHVRREVPLVQMEAVGRIQMVGRRIIIELTQD